MGNLSFSKAQIANTPKKKSIFAALVALIVGLFGVPAAKDAVTSNKVPQGLISTTAAYIQAGAATNYSRLPTAWVPQSAPVGAGTLISVAANAPAIQAAYNGAVAGSIIEVANGTITGTFDTTLLNLNRTFPSSAPVVIRTLNRHGVTLTNCGATFSGSESTCANLTGQYNFLQGFVVTNTNYIATVQSGLHNTLYDNRFDAIGRDADCGSVGLLHVLGSGSIYGGGVTTEAGIVRNEINQPKGCTFFMEHGSNGNMFSHNIVTGPEGVTARYAYPFRLGWDFGYTDNSAPTVQFNTIRDYGSGGTAWVDNKVSGSRFLYNLVESNCATCADLQLDLRANNNVTVVGNLQIGKDVWMWLSGNNIDVRYNKVIQTSGRDAIGPLVVHNTNCRSDGQYCGTGITPGQPEFTKALTNSVIKDNAFVSLGTNVYHSQLYMESGFGGGTLLASASGNQFTDNYWSRKINPNNWYAGPYSGQSATSIGSWSGNRFECTYGCGATATFSGVIGLNSNIVSAPWQQMFPDMSAAPSEVELVNPNQLMVCDPLLVTCAGSPPPATTTTTTPAATTTTTTLPITQPTLCAGGTRYEAEAMTQTGMANSAVSGASGGSGLGSFAFPASASWNHPGAVGEFRFRYYSTGGATRTLTGGPGATVVFPDTFSATLSTYSLPYSGTGAFSLTVPAANNGGMFLDYVDACPGAVVTTTTSTTTTTTTPSVVTCRTIQSESGTPFGGAAISADATANGGSVMGWFATGSGFSVNLPSFAAGSWTIMERYWSDGGSTASRSAPVGGTATYLNTGQGVWTNTPLVTFTASGAASVLTMTKLTGGLASDQLVICPASSATTTPPTSLPRLCAGNSPILTPGCGTRPNVTVIPRRTTIVGASTLVPPRTTRR